MTYFTRAWLHGATERAIKTAAQSLLGVIGVGGLGILDVDWQGALSVAALAGLISLLTSIATPEFVAGPLPAKVEPYAPVIPSTVTDAPAITHEETAAALAETQARAEDREVDHG